MVLEWGVGECVEWAYSGACARRDGVLWVCQSASDCGGHGGVDQEGGCVCGQSAYYNGNYSWLPKPIRSEIPPKLRHSLLLPLLQRPERLLLLLQNRHQPLMQITLLPIDPTQEAIKFSNIPHPFSITLEESPKAS